MSPKYYIHNQRIWLLLHVLLSRCVLNGIRRLHLHQSKTSPMYKNQKANTCLLIHSWQWLMMYCKCCWFFHLQYSHMHAPASRPLHEWFVTGGGCRPAVVLIQPFTCVGPDRSVWGRVCRCEPTPPNPRLHYSTSPVKQHTDAGTSPSLQRRRGTLYCLMQHWGNIITSAKSNLNIVLSVQTTLRVYATLNFSQEMLKRWCLYYCCI